MFEQPIDWRSIFSSHFQYWIILPTQAFQLCSARHVAVPFISPLICYSRQKRCRTKKDTGSCMRTQLTVRCVIKLLGRYCFLDKQTRYKFDYHIAAMCEMWQHVIALLDNDSSRIRTSKRTHDTYIALTCKNALNPTRMWLNEHIMLRALEKTLILNNVHMVYTPPPHTHTHSKQDNTRMITIEHIFKTRIIRRAHDKTHTRFHAHMIKGGH